MTTLSLNQDLTAKLTKFGQALVNQEQARVIVPPQQNSTGFWFGGGNMIESVNRDLYVVGRYRNFGDSRTGIGSGERGLELAIFKSEDQGETFNKVASWSKSDLDVEGCPVLSIEGSAIRWTDDGVELYVSTEKDNVGYPAGFEDYLKPGTGVWTIDRLQAKNIEALPGSPVKPFCSNNEPNHLHLKDPFVYEGQEDDAIVFFCTHPFSWSSSNTGFIDSNLQDDGVFGFFPRGESWDVAMTRGTCLVDVPMVGAFEEIDATLVFYDGGECVRDLEQHKTAVTRPRGYSCEELGGLAYFVEGDISQINRISKYAPLFVSPHGTGCSRYVDILTTGEGLYATWQQGQADGSQPLVMNFLSNSEIENILS
ncbi:exo-alpha-sialidase [Thalassoglobus sp.]|uniref:exo-alpha-sialidase n=1 Tax=Thalassoglobus sp. TaxID=2795869 RepID=UPI003AA85484